MWTCRVERCVGKSVRPLLRDFVETVTWARDCLFEVPTSPHMMCRGIEVTDRAEEEPEKLSTNPE